MPEKLLHDAHVGAAFEQVRRIGMPQRVRRDLAVETGHLGRATHESEHALPAQPAAALIEEHGSPGLALIDEARGSSMVGAWAGTRSIGVVIDCDAGPS